MHPSSFQVHRPFDFLTPVFISVFQFTSVRVSLCCKSINISNVDSGANSYFTNPLAIKALIETRHHTPELPFWYFHICLEGIYVNIIVEEHWNWAASSLYLKDRKILLFIFSLVFTPCFAYAHSQPPPPTPRCYTWYFISHQASHGDGTRRPFLQFLFEKSYFFAVVPLCSSLRVFDLGCAVHCFGGELLNWL